jgi:3-oxoadipate enol-lactonase
VPYAFNDGVRIWWDEHGAGEPVLLCMGHAYTSAMWHRAIVGLAARHRLLSFDNRGVGHSDAPWPPYSVEQFARDGIAVMDAAGVERCHVYGVSMGGLTAEELALSYPDRVRSLVLGCTGCIEREDNPSRLPFAVQKTLLHVAVRVNRLRPRRASRHYGADTDDAVKADDLALLRTSRVTSSGLIGQAIAVGTYSSRRRLANLDIPTLVIHGDADDVVAVDMGKELASVIPGARLEILSGAGHNYLTEPFGRANSLVLNFWDDVESNTA